ncbi:DUF4962 domain-containing protein [Gemmatimonadota bacterium]
MRYSIIIFLLYLTFSLGCSQDGGPGPLDMGVYRALKQTNRIHPRLLLTEKAVEKLRSDIEGSHKWLWDRYREDLPDKLASARELPERLGRGEGNLVSDLAFAWRVTGRDSLFASSRDYLLELCRKDVWDPEYSLAQGHIMMGVALAYDWLYPAMNRDQRSLVAERLGEEAERQYRMIADQRAWYRNQYLQNHAHVHYSGLAYAAVALYGEDPRAQQWLAACVDFYDRVLSLSLSDGGSIEGMSYGNYALEYVLRYMELARSVLKLDYYDNPWIKNYPKYLIHSLLPVVREEEWAMSFGDNPRHGNYHGPEHQLFLIASRCGDTAAQWLGKKLIGLRSSGLASASWCSILWYDPEIKEANPESFPTLWHFNDLDQVMLRSAWEDTSAVMIGIKCGSFMGRARSQDTIYDLGCAHGHPDAGSFQIYAYGRFLAVDPLYTYFKRSANHNTLLVRNRGQLGEDSQWFAAAEALYFKHYPTVVETRSTSEYDYVLTDMAPAYHPALGLKRALRHFLFIKPDLLLVADELTLDQHGVLFSYPADTLRLGGALKFDSGYVIGTRGRAEIIFDGPRGVYDIAVNYLDNAPRTGSYALLVDGDTVKTWQDTVLFTDDHLEVAQGIRLADSSSISFCAEPMGEGARLTKIMVYSSEVRAGRDVQWLLHCDPETEFSRRFTRIEAASGPVGLDIYPLAPAQRNHQWNLHQVKQGSQMKQTQRLVIKPVFTDSSSTMLTLLHMRKSDSPTLEWLRGYLFRDIATVTWGRNRKTTALTFNLKTREIEIKR